MNEKYISVASDDKGAFDVLEFIFRKQMQSKIYIYRIVEYSAGYSNI